MGIKKGVRVLAYAESFDKQYDKSILVGLVMRRDLIVDGFVIGTTTLGGLDSTDVIIRMYKELNREDISYIMLSGVVISWFNVIDLNRLYNEIKIPVIALSYEESEGILKYYKEYFPEDWERRVYIHRKNGERERLLLHTGYRIFFRYIGVDKIEAEEVVNAFTLEGKYPEPVRVAKLIARGVLISIRKGYINLLR